jgi:hypothetical protein
MLGENLESLLMLFDLKAELSDKSYFFTNLFREAG